MFKAIVEGKEGGNYHVVKGSSARLRVSLLDLDGMPIDLGTVDEADTVTLELYDREDRRNASVQSIALPITTHAAGFCTAAILAATITCAVGRYYGYVKRVDVVATVPGAVTFSRKAVVVNVN